MTRPKVEHRITLHPFTWNRGSHKFSIRHNGVLVGTGHHDTEGWFGTVNPEWGESFGATQADLREAIAGLYHYDDLRAQREAERNVLRLSRVPKGPHTAPMKPRTIAALVGDSDYTGDRGLPPKTLPPRERVAEPIDLAAYRALLLGRES